MNIHQARSLFPALSHSGYFNTATMAVGNLPARQAYVRAVDEWANGKFDWKEAEKAGEDCRRLFAAIINADHEEIAIVPAVSTAAGMVAAQLGRAKRGENILVADMEFSSNLFPWLSLRDSGYDVRVVKSIDGMVHPGAYESLADGGTRLIAVSAVQSSNGYRVDLTGLRRVADRSGAWLFVDACQAAGAVSIDVRQDGVDFLAASSHKFLLGSRGMGYLFVRRELLDRCRPVLPGWKAAAVPSESFYGSAMNLSTTASKLDTSLSWFAALAERESLGILDSIGPEKVLEYNQRLSGLLHARLVERCPGFTPFQEHNRSTIVSVPVTDSERTMALLRGANFVASLRARNLRLALHFYNTAEEVDRVVEIIAMI